MKAIDRIAEREIEKHSDGERGRLRRKRGCQALHFSLQPSAMA